MKFKLQISILYSLLVVLGINAQNNYPTQTIRGTVTDRDSGTPIP